MNKNVKVIVAAHKQYQMPEGDIYLPVHVGAEGKASIGYTPDNSGDNISAKNPSYCELTGFYWAWKNLDADYIGLAHYRRHFTAKSRSQRKGNDRFSWVLTDNEAAELFEKYDIIVPSRRKYYIESLYSHYAHTHYAEHLDETRKIIGQMYPDYLGAYDRTVKKTSGYMFNMMIMKKEYLDSYCKWLFDILFELEKRISMPELSAFQGRFYGRVSEIIFNVWLEYQLEKGIIKQEQIRELDCIHMEKINWFKKGKAFVSAKLFGKKYEGSF